MFITRASRSSRSAWPSPHSRSWSWSGSTFGRSQLKLYGLLVGVTVGYALSAATGLIDPMQYRSIGVAPWVGLPRLSGFLQLSFDWSLLPMFAIVSICGALKSFGNLTMCEKINDDTWVRPDIARIRGGLVADGIAVTVSGLLAVWRPTPRPAMSG